VGAGGCDSLRLPDHLLADPFARFCDLGSDYHTRRIDIERRMRNHIAQLTALGYRVTLEPAA
jgi:transposase